jgi:hypothetical protein
MSGHIDFDQHLEAYLAIRDALGLTAGTRARVLRGFSITPAARQRPASRSGLPP